MQFTRMRLALLILVILTSSTVFAQGQKSEFYPEGYGTIGNRTKVNALSFRTPNTTDVFYKTLNKKFGKPKVNGTFLLYSCYIKSWSKSKIVLRIEKSIDTNLDHSKTNTVFIFAETKGGTDLLQRGSTSYKRIEKYFMTLFKTTIKNQKPDNFK